MGKASKIFNRLLHGLIAICLSFMAIFVFTNVILRYFFNSGITWAEEASRYLFIWLIFLGAIVAFRENAHLGVDALVQKFSVRGRKILFGINNLLILLTMGLVVHGSFKLTVLTVNQRSASMDMPLAFIYGAGLLTSTCMVVISLGNLYRLITRRMSANDLVMITGSEDQERIDQITKGSSGKGRKS